MGYSFSGYLEERFRDDLTRAVSRFIKADNVRGVPVKVQHISIRYIDTSLLLKYEDTVELPAVLTADIQSDEDGRSFHSAIQLHAAIKGTFSLFFDDFTVSCTGHCRTLPSRGNRKFTDDLLPRLSKEEIEAQAEQILDRAYGYLYVHRRPTRIDPVYIAKQLGIHIYAAHLSEGGDIRGEYVFSDTVATLYDSQSRRFYGREVKGHSIMIDSQIRDKPELRRFTIMHELVHAYVQRFAFYLIAMCDREFNTFCCPVRTNEECTFLDAFVERIERQADAIASCALMPKEAFTKKANDLLAEHGAWRTSSSIKSVVDKIAAFFGVSITAARRRMLELGFTEVLGVYNYIDGAYVPSFAFAPGSLNRQQTFTISRSYARELLENNKKLTKMVMKNVICFVENHFILNDPTYLTSDKKLTPYGREHLNECALKFDIVFGQRDYSAERNRLGRNVLYRTVNSTCSVEILYSEDNVSIEEKARILLERNTDVLELVKTLPEDFPEALSKVIAWTGLTQEQIAEKSWVTERTIRNLISNTDITPTIKVMMRLCIGMSLPFEVSVRLLNRAGYQFRSTLRDLAYMQLLMFPYQYGIDEANRFLEAQGLEVLGKQQ